MSNYGDQRARTHPEPFYALFLDMHYLHFLRVAHHSFPFAEQLIGLQRDFLALPFFALCLISPVVSMYDSIRDITESVAALELEVSERMQGDGSS